MRPGVALCALLGIGPSLIVRAEPVHYGLRAEVGAEYDSNAGRLERLYGSMLQKPIVGSPLGRFVLAGDLAAPIGFRHVLSLSGALAGKHFTRADVRDEDVLVAEASGGWSVRAGERTAIGLSGAY